VSERREGGDQNKEGSSPLSPALPHEGGGSSAVEVLLVDGSPRGRGRTAAVLAAVAAGTVEAGAHPVTLALSGELAARADEWHHFLALDSLRNVLSGFFGAFVIPPGLYVPRAGFTDEGDLGEEWREQAALQGRALVELARGVRGSSDLGRLGPHV